MTTQRSIRASDHDRAGTAEMLCDAYAVGCLDRSELDQRSSLAYSAKTLGELRDLTADLPAWLFDRQPRLPSEGCYRLPRPRPGLEHPARLLLAVAGTWLTVAVVMWIPLLAVPLAVTWLVLAVHARSSLFRPAPPRPRDGGRSPGGPEEHW